MTNIPKRTRFFNIFRNVFKMPLLEVVLSKLTNNQGYENFFVKLIPQNYQYPKGSYRIVKRRGIRFRLDVSEYMEWVIYFGLTVEDRESLYPLVKKGMVILDIGTNIGETLLYFASQTGANGHVFGFEPVSLNYRKCLDNISLNTFENIEVNQLAVSDKQETLYFGDSNNSNSGGIFMHKEKGNTLDSVRAITLDHFVNEKKIKKIDLIKIDVEGFEGNVLKGAENTIRDLKPLLFVEVDETNLKRQGSSAVKLETLIRSYGYSVKKTNQGKVYTGSSQHYDIICEPFPAS